MSKKASVIDSLRSIVDRLCNAVIHDYRLSKLVAELQTILDDTFNICGSSTDPTKPVFWTVDTSGEELQYETLDEAVEMYLDGLSPEQTPEVITAFGYARTDLSKEWSDLPEFVVETVIERLDEEYGDPFSSGFPITDRMRKAAAVFAEVILREYEPWACIPVCQQEIDTQVWIREKRPHWLE
jgi:hypothetical protein